MAFDFPHLHAIGTHYEVGLSMGINFKSRIETYLNEFTCFKSTILPYLDTIRGKQVYEQFLKNVKNVFPWYVDEMRGIADGCGLPFEWIAAINFRVEILHLNTQPENQIVMECSDFYLLNESEFLLVHNEDASPSIYSTGYLITLKIKSSEYNGKNAPEEEFTCYCYPGHLPGNAFGFNKAGFVYGVNALRPKLICLNNIPRQFINRAMYSGKTLHEIESILLETPIAYGFNLNLTCITDDLSILKTKWNKEYKTNDDVDVLTESLYPIAWSYELAPNSNDNTKNIVSKHCVLPTSFSGCMNSAEGFYSFDSYNHFNHYERIKIEEGNVPSSRHRETRVKQLPKPKNEFDLLKIASDHEDPEYPLFREPSKFDSGKTVATGVFNMKTCNLNVIFGEPLGNYELMVKISMK